MGAQPRRNGLPWEKIMEIPSNQNRRSFLRTSLLSSAGIALVGIPVLRAEEKKDEEDVTPNEDLMREHGLLRRIVLLYEANLTRMPKKEHQPQIIKKSAETIRSFIENYHEKLEEEFLFPALEKVKREVALVETLKTQHQVGRKLTARIIDLSGKSSSLTALEESMRSFIYMYNAHADREDTILFPAFKEVVGPKRYKELGDEFEDREHKMFGKEGFEGVLAQVAEFEKQMGIYDLNVYTPKI
jgi:hemerythrin-like domain-containing protein